MEFMDEPCPRQRFALDLFGSRRLQNDALFRRCPIFASKLVASLGVETRPKMIQISILRVAPVILEVDAGNPSGRVGGTYLVFSAVQDLQHFAAIVARGRKRQLQ